MKNKRTFGLIEAVFDILYLLTVGTLGLLNLLLAKSGARALFGVMALVLAAGDGFHLVPRISSALQKDRVWSESALGRGKMLASLGMTVFYVLLWQVGAGFYPPAAPYGFLVYIVAAVRVFLCLLPQNRWGDKDVPASWNLYRNIPFMLLGLAALLLFAAAGEAVPASLSGLPILIALSFLFYLPVVFWGQRYPMLGMLMLPKSCVYVIMAGLGLLLK